MTGSLLGHLAFRFSNQPENIATEALSHILSHSLSAKGAVLSFVESLGVVLPPSVIFKCQSSSGENGRPDLVAVDGDNHRFLVVEAKFWAGLTDNQPLGYLRCLPTEHAAVLLFLAPSANLTLLWGNIIACCRTAAIDLGEERRISSDTVIRSVRTRHIMAATSWRSFLRHIQQILTEKDDIATLSDLAQLQGLCDRVDQEAFLPVLADELTSSIPSRLIQLCGVMDEVYNRAVRENVAEARNYKVSGGPGSYYRSMIMAGFGCQLQVNCYHWKQHYNTPLWLTIRDIKNGDKWVFSQRLRDALGILEFTDPRRVFFTENEALVPLTITLGVEKAEVIENIFSQLREVADLLSKSVGTSTEST